MSNVAIHRFTSAKPVGTDGTQVQSTNWNDGHQFQGGNHGSVLLRDTTDASFGASWLQSPSLAGAFVQGAGAAVLPAYSVYALPSAAPTVGDLLSASSSTSFAAVAAVATGSVLVSKGAAVLPAWSSSLSITNLNLAGVITAIAGITAAGNGASFPVAIANLTAQGADIAATNLLASAAAGLYRVSAWTAVTRAGTTNSVLPLVRIRWNNGTAQSLQIAASTSGNLLTTFTQASMTLKSAAAVAITYETSGFSTTGGTTMQYETYISLEAIY